MSRVTSPTLAQTERMLNLVPYLSTHQHIPISKLCDEFGVSKKELLDDLNTLWMCGLPGYTPLELIDLSFDAGFVSIRNAEILEIPRSLTTEEIVVLILGLDLLSKSVESLAKEINNLQNRLRSIVGDFARAVPTIDSGHRAIIQRAISERQNLKITYYSPVSDNVSVREITPIEIQVDSGNEYLLAMTDKGLRNFRLDRVSEVILTSTTKQNFESQGQSNNAEIEVQLKITKDSRQVAELFNLDLAQTALAPDGIHKALGFSSEWFVRALMSKGLSVQLVDPADIRSEIAARCAELIEIYESGALPK